MKKLFLFICVIFSVTVMFSSCSKSITVQENTPAQTTVPEDTSMKIGSDEEWRAAFSYEAFSNVTVTRIQTEDNYKSRSIFKLDGFRTYNELSVNDTPFTSSYSELKDGQYVEYVHGENTGWQKKKNNCSEKQWEEKALSLIGFDYTEKFRSAQYDETEKCYVITKDNSNDSQTDRLFFKDGKLIKCVSEVAFGGSGYTVTTEFSDYGSTVVELPKV